MKKQFGDDTRTVYASDDRMTWAFIDFIDEFAYGIDARGIDRYRAEVQCVHFADYSLEDLARIIAEHASDYWQEAHDWTPGMMGAMVLEYVEDSYTDRIASGNNRREVMRAARALLPWC